MTRTTAIHRLRLVLAANAIFSITGGLIALVAGSWLSRELGIDHVGLTRILGAGLVLFGIDVGVLSRLAEDRLVPGALVVSLADASWVAGTVVVVATGVLTGAGNVVAIAIGLAVADFGVAQYWLRTKAVRTVAVATSAAAAA
jgi:hypothetical protein